MWDRIGSSVAADGRSIGIGLVAAALLSCLVLPDRAHAAGGDAIGLTNQLLRRAEEHRSVPSGSPPELLDALTELALERQDALLDELESDPEAYLRHALPAAVRDSLPAAVRELVEEHVEIEGELEVLWADDFETGANELVYRLRTPTESYNLHFAGKAPQLTSGARVRAAGVVLGAELALAQGGDPSLQTLTLPAATAVTGEQRTAIILFNFSNDGSKPFGSSQISSLMFGNSNSVYDYYGEVSFGQIWFSGDVLGWYTTPTTAARAATTRRGPAPQMRRPRRTSI